MRDTMARFVAGLLPARVVYFAFIRVWGAATNGHYSSSVVPEVTCAEALTRFEYDNGLA